MSQEKPRHMFHEVPFTVTPGYFFQKHFCFRCKESKPTKGGQKKGSAKLFVCGDCIKARAPA